MAAGAGGPFFYVRLYSTFLFLWCIILLSNFPDGRGAGAENGVRILKETRDYIAVYKNAGLAVESKRPGQRTLTGELLSLLAERRSRKGERESQVRTAEAPGGSRTAIRQNGSRTASRQGKGTGSGDIPYAAVINRLDQPVEGIVLFALNPKAAAELSRQLTEGTMEKEYLAAVSPVPEREEAELCDFLLKDGRTNVSRIVPEGTKGAKKALLSYRILQKQETSALLAVRLVTGRHHQIRVQLAGMGCPILGDEKYGRPAEQAAGRYGGKVFPALCAVHLAFNDPADGSRIEIRVAPEESLFAKAGFSRTADGEATD